MFLELQKLEHLLRRCHDSVFGHTAVEPLSDLVEADVVSLNAHLEKPDVFGSQDHCLCVVDRLNLCSPLTAKVMMTTIE